MAERDWQSKKESGVSWKPTHTGTKKEDNIVHLKADDKSYIDGHYIGTKHDAGPKSDSQVHTIRIDGCGKKGHLSEKIEKGSDVGVWGTHVLNDQMAGIEPGAFIRILWLGKKKPKKAGGNEYHDWEVFVDPSEEPLNLGGAGFTADEKPEAQTASPAPEATEEPAVAAEEPVAEGGDDDDLPF